MLYQKLNIKGLNAILELNKIKPQEAWLLSNDLQGKKEIEDLKITSLFIIFIDIGFKEFITWFD